MSRVLTSYLIYNTVKNVRRGQEYHFQHFVSGGPAVIFLFAQCLHGV